MSNEQQLFLNMKRLPAVLNREQVAWLLGWDTPMEVSIVTNAGHLAPLGKPAKNSRKLYATAKIEQLRQDERWLNKSRLIISDFHHRKNMSRRSWGSGGSED